MTTTAWELSTSIQTHTGIAFSLVDPKPEDVRFADIVHALARMPRFTGHTKEYMPLSVAQHSVSVAKMFLREFGYENNPTALAAALLHDAHEAYIGDLSTPLANTIGKHITRPIKERIQTAIHARFGIPPLSEVMANDIKWCDTQILYAEREAHMVSAPHLWPEAPASHVPRHQYVEAPQNVRMAQLLFEDWAKHVAGLTII